MRPHETVTAVLVLVSLTAAGFGALARGSHQTLSPAEEAKVMAELNRIELHLERLSKDHAATAKEVRRDLNAIARIHGSGCKHHTTSSSHHVALLANHKAHEIAAICTIVNIRHYRYPKAIAWEERMKKRHGLQGADLEFCDQHRAEYTVAQEKTKEMQQQQQQAQAQIDAVKTMPKWTPSRR